MISLFVLLLASNHQMAANVSSKPFLAAIMTTSDRSELHYAHGTKHGVVALPYPLSSWPFLRSAMGKLYVNVSSVGKRDLASLVLRVGDITSGRATGAVIVQERSFVSPDGTMDIVFPGEVIELRHTGTGKVLFRIPMKAVRKAGARVQAPFALLTIDWSPKSDAFGVTGIGTRGVSDDDDETERVGFVVEVKSRRIISVGPAVKICWGPGKDLFITRRLIDLGSAARSLLAQNVSMPFAVYRRGLYTRRERRLAVGAALVAASSDGNLVVRATPLEGGFAVRLAVFDATLKTASGVRMDIQLNIHSSFADLTTSVVLVGQ